MSKLLCNYVRKCKDVEGDNCELIENPNLLGRTICNNVSIVHSTNSLTKDDVYDVSVTVYFTMGRMASGIK
jgi:hypothetical protein